MKIKLNLVLSLILEAVKAETHIKGQVDRAIDDKAAKVAYTEEAGDEEFHTRKLMRGIYTSIDNLKGELAQYVTSSSSSVGDNIVSAINESTDSIVITLEVSSSFNTGLTDSLARLCSKYIEDSTLVLWWGTFNANQAQYYTALVASDSIAISRCFTKNAPKRVSTPYTTKINNVGSTIEMSVGEDEEVTYTLDEGAVDDLEMFSDYNGLKTYRSQNGFRIFAKHEGVYTVKLYSVHNESVCKYISVLVSNE